MSQKRDVNSEEASALTQKNDPQTKKMKVVDYLITSLPSQMNLTFDTDSTKIGYTMFTINGRLLIPKADVLNGTLVDGGWKYKWNTAAPHPMKKPERLMIPYLSGAIGIARHVETELAAFNIYFTENMFRTILNHTNETIQISQCYIFPKINYGYPLSLTELKAFIGILYYSAAMKYNRITSHACGIDIFDTVMSKERFEHLIRCLSFEKNITRRKKKHSDSLSGITDIWTEFITKCSEVFRPSTSCAIDELLVDFIGNDNNELTLPKISENCMMKLIILCDSKNQYFISGVLHMNNNQSGSEISEYQIEKITKPIHGTNINITYVTDRLISVALSKKMLRQYKLTTVAILHKNHPEIPEDTILTENRPVGTSIFLYNSVDELQLCTYYSINGEVEVLLSNIHFESAIKDPEGIPKVVEYYNTTKDEIRAIKRVYYKYSCSKQTTEWFLAIFYSILDLAGINSLAILNSNRSRCGKPSVHRGDFLYKLAVDLMLPYLNEQLMNVNTSDSVRNRIKILIQERQKFNVICTPAQQSKVICPPIELQKVMKPIGSERDSARNHTSLKSTVNKVQDCNYPKKSTDSSTLSQYNQCDAIKSLYSVNNNIAQAASGTLPNFKIPYFNSYVQSYPGIVIQSVIPHLEIEWGLSTSILQLSQALRTPNLAYNQYMFPLMINPSLTSSIVSVQQLQSMYPPSQPTGQMQPLKSIMHMIEKIQKAKDHPRQIYIDNAEYKSPQPEILPLPSALLMTTYQKTKLTQSVSESKQVLSVCGICNSIGDKKYYIECFKCSVLLCTVHRKILCTSCYSSRQSTALNAYVHASKKSKCGVCGPKMFLKYSIQCSKCGTFLCLEHRRILCCFCYDM